MLHTDRPRRPVRPLPDRHDVAAQIDKRALYTVPNKNPAGFIGRKILWLYRPDRSSALRGAASLGDARHPESRPDNRQGFGPFRSRHLRAHCASRRRSPHASHERPRRHVKRAVRNPGEKTPPDRAGSSYRPPTRTLSRPEAALTCDISLSGLNTDSASSQHHNPPGRRVDRVLAARGRAHRWCSPCPAP